MEESLTEERAANQRSPSVSGLFDDLTNRLQAEEALDVSAYIARYPEHASELRQFLPAIEVLVDLGRSALREQCAIAAVQADGGLSTGVLGATRLEASRELRTRPCPTRGHPLPNPPPEGCALRANLK